eukprot:TRINITY_DN660_c0_g3_i1.p1 TRINITY_DN660_c0_g3~~TRINITY_DN660_c0_g3_i1.p1  ORF type:complete len:407 (+),score=61.99 TRINITY_DN660_c0_g3_i1:524-1744(+)
MEYTIDLKADGYSAAYNVTSEHMLTEGNGQVRSVLIEGLVSGLELLCSGDKEDTRGAGVYVGTMGFALAIDKVLDSGVELPDALREEVCKVREGILRTKADEVRRDATFLEGKSGILAVQCTHHANNESHTDALLSLARAVLMLPASECELLYGRSGYLYSLLKVKDVIPAKYESRYNDVLCRVIRQIFQQGVDCSTALQRSGVTPLQTLMYMWHDKVYYGAAHGVAGILHTLLLCPLDLLMSINPAIVPSIEATLKELTLLELPTGNYPSSLGKGGRLAQFCHGAPGFILLYCKAYEVFGDSLYLAKAEKTGSFLKNNIKTKGVGLCHGVSGSVYALLALYRVTGNIAWLGVTIHISMYMVHEYTRFYRVSDRPLSLYEGVAGMVAVLADLLTNPRRATMPGFDV